MKHTHETISLIRVLLPLTFGAIVAVGCGATVHKHGHDHSQMAQQHGHDHSQMSPPAAATSPAPPAETSHGEVAAPPPAGDSLADYRLGAEDLLQITLFNVPEAEKGVTPRVMEERVSQQGAITLPLLGEIRVAGLSTSALEQELEKRYGKYMYGPQVGILVKEYRSQKISVIGEVQKPGVYELPGPRTLADLLAMAGGVKTATAGPLVRLYRQGVEGRQTYVIDLAALHTDAESPYLALAQDRDVIDVPEAERFFVDGAVKKPGSYFLTRSYTLTEALANAGGRDTLATTTGLMIFRRHESGQVETIRVNLNKVLARKAADPRIQSGDLIVVPESMAKFILDRFFGRFSLALGLTPFLL